jgi:hypothetical protein
MKVLFLPIGIIGSFLAAFAAKGVFSRVWGIVDEEEPPDPKHRDVTWTKLVAAAALEGAIFRVSRATVAHGSRIAVARLTGSWPGEEAPEERA